LTALQGFVDDFAVRTRQLKSIILLHSAQPDEETHQVAAVLRIHMLAVLFLAAAAVPFLL